MEKELCYGQSVHSSFRVYIVYMNTMYVYRQWLYGGVWVGLYVLHVAYLSLGKFHYGYNMIACVTAGEVHVHICW